MGCENMGPFLHALVRFAKPLHVLEVGAGFTSLFLLQALHDNAEELGRLQRLQRQGRCTTQNRLTGARSPFCLPSFFGTRTAVMRPSAGDGRDAKAEQSFGALYAVDNLGHPDTSAHRVVAAAERLGLRRHLHMHMADFKDLLPSDLPAPHLDLMWLDIGLASDGGHKMDTFMRRWWPHLNPEGGMVLIHSTVANAQSRSWLERLRSRQQWKGHPARVELLAPTLQLHNATHVFDGLCRRSSVSPFGEPPPHSACPVAAVPPEVDADVDTDTDPRRQQRPFGENGEAWSMMSWFEPHKVNQGSFTILQKRGRGWREPVHTEAP